ncbi:MAG TPA: N-acetylneuraminate synthase family protein [Candidatus Paceibacterota bacterium]|nr:N-acetylneuraminate synthase family protein [Candidatus Woesebacteria bacterium]HOY11385.1 N-acetylneuraminate synthase family protein [Candidatus Paceibacterota bacterium]HPN89392.1 N-acetylneuraminate synthase family protein [Candidatus Paceibacterota bacterium]HQB26821.1 N-acetylneuraminate synthase family protein [Candidatus Paceibacterota bacterium]
MKIGGKPVGLGCPTFVVAEIGINHNGSLPLALESIEVAADIGVDAVKFQKRAVNIVYSPEELATPRDFDREILDAALERQEIEGVRYDVFPPDVLARIMAGEWQTNGVLKHALEFGLKEYDLIDKRCAELGIAWSASPWDGLSAHFINGFSIGWVKIASACLTNRDLLERVRETGKTVVLSTGGSTIRQIQEAVRILGRENLALMHCLAVYPPADEDTNLLVLETLRRAFPGVPVGFSSHARDTFPVVAAVAMGAELVEAHLTLDRNMSGSDHKASLEPLEFKNMVSQIRRLETLRGDGIKRVLSPEAKIMEKLRRVDNLF